MHHTKPVYCATEHGTIDVAENPLWWRVFSVNCPSDLGVIMWRKLTFVLAGVAVCLWFVPIGFWAVLPLLGWLAFDAPDMLERVKFTRQARREVEELTRAGG